MAVFPKVILVVTLQYYPASLFHTIRVNDSGKDHSICFKDILF